MKIINPSIEILYTGFEKEPVAPEKLIEKVGRTCYKSEDKITNDSATKFVGGLIKRAHEAMVEHSSLIYKTNPDTYIQFIDDWNCLMHDADLLNNEYGLKPFLRFTDHTTEDGEERYIISGNMRAWRDYAKACVIRFGFPPFYLYTPIHDFPLFFPEFQNELSAIVENDVLTQISVSDLKGDFEFRTHHDITVKFICDRGVSHEIVRHRTASFAQESTRYCNYGLGKFGGEITVVMPAKWLNADIDTLSDDPAYQAWAMATANSEHYYFDMLAAGSTPQEARAVLLNSLKTEVIMTGTEACWDHFFSLRCAPDAHPDIQVVAKMTQAEFAEAMPERYGKHE